MKKFVKSVLFAAGLVSLLVVCSGCGSLSLFSSRHVHYHGSPETDQKVDQLVQRVEALEKAKP